MIKTIRSDLITPDHGQKKVANRAFRAFLRFLGKNFFLPYGGSDMKKIFSRKKSQMLGIVGLM